MPYLQQKANIEYQVSKHPKQLLWLQLKHADDSVINIEVPIHSIMNKVLDILIRYRFGNFLLHKKRFIIETFNRSNTEVMKKVMFGECLLYNIGATWWKKKCPCTFRVDFPRF